MLLALMLTVTLPNGFTPRPYQAAAMRYFDGGGKRAITVWHRRAGKDLVALHQTAKAAHEVIGPYWHFFPTFSQGRRAIWEGFTSDGKRIMEGVFPGFLDPKRRGSIVKRCDHSQMLIELKSGSIWRLMGSDNTEVVGAGPKGIVISEHALCRPSTWDLVRPMLRESGGWMWSITTPRGKNHAHRLFQAATPESGWFRDIKTVHDTNLRFHGNRSAKLLTPDEMMAEELAEGMLPELVRQEYLCDWSAALVGSVWGDLVEQLEKRGGITEFDVSGDGVFTTWDLGISDATGVWMWRPRGDGVELIDHYEAHGKPLSHYFDEIEKRAADRGYKYARHFLPHDARARTLTTGQSVQDHFNERYGSSMVTIGPSLSLLDGIQAGRWLLQREGTRIHSSCGDGLEALRAYRYEYDEDKKTFGRKPLHDWASHTADAFRGVAVVVKATERLTRKPPKPPPALESVTSSTVTPGDVFDEPEAQGGGRLS